MTPPLKLAVAALTCLAAAACQCPPTNEDQETFSDSHGGEPAIPELPDIVPADYQENCVLKPELPPEGTPQPTRALNIVFKNAQPKLTQLAAQQAKAHGRCSLSLSLAADSGDPLLGALTKFPGATISPTFGCSVLGTVDPSDWTLKYWIIRFPEPPGENVEALLREVTQKINAEAQGKMRVEVASIPKPPGSEDPYVGPDGTDDSANPKTRCGTQWYHHDTLVTKAWRDSIGVWPPDPSKGQMGPVIFVADFGFSFDHHELQGVLIEKHGWNTCHDDANVSRGTSKNHGTAVVGLLAARRDGRGIMGVAYNGEVWPLQASCDNPMLADGEPWAKAVYKVMNTNVGNRRKVLLLEVETAGEYNFEARYEALRTAIDKAIEAKVVVITAAGNKGVDVTLVEDGTAVEELSGSIVVGSTFYGSRKRSGNHGDWVTVSAPGERGHDVTISSAGPTVYYPGIGGTSGAAAKVAGVVALMLAHNDELTPACIRQILTSLPKPVKGDDGTTGGMFLDAVTAIERARSADPCPPPPPTPG